jgi:hypothetical protein
MGADLSNKRRANSPKLIEHIDNFFHLRKADFSVKTEN